MTDERRAHMDDVAGTLWPVPHVVSRDRPPAGHLLEAELMVLPSLRRPRVLAPVDRRAAETVVRHHGEGARTAGRRATSALALALRAGLGPLVARDRLYVSAPQDAGARSLQAHLSDVLGSAVVLGTHLGPPRANRKPVLQLLDSRGRITGYAKVAVDDLTDSLVRDEAAALETLGRARTRLVEVARVEHVGLWSGRALLVQSALPVWAPRAPVGRTRLVHAMAEVAAIGRRDDVPLAGGTFRRELDGRLHRLPPTRAAAELAGLWRRLEDAAGDVRLSFGAGHGDWAPWNMAGLSDRLLVWDWERFRPAVPVGFDLLHHELQTDLVARRTEPAQAARHLVDDAAGLLQPLGVRERVATLTACLYGVDLATRYLADRQLEAGARLGDVGSWLLPAVTAGLRHLEGDPT